MEFPRRSGGGGDSKCGCTTYFRQRPYSVEHTRSHPNSEVKQQKARLVLGWGTAWEVLRVLLAFCFQKPPPAPNLRSDTPPPSPLPTATYLSNLP